MKLSTVIYICEQEGGYFKRTDQSFWCKLRYDGRIAAADDAVPYLDWVASDFSPDTTWEWTQSLNE